MGYWVVVCVLVSRSVRVGLLVVVFACEGVWVLVSSGERGCLGVGCVVAGGVLPVWLRDGVARGGVSVGFDVGGRAFVLSGVGVPVSCVAASGSGSGVGGVRVCVPCARVVFGDSWCFLVLRRWARAVGLMGRKLVGVLVWGWWFCRVFAFACACGSVLAWFCIRVWFCFFLAFVCSFAGE